jgi:glutamate/tyrosine decarboxylase-like PLP-dependent enzyme
MKHSDSKIPKTAFIDPHGTNASEVADLFQRLSAQVVASLAGAGAQKPYPSLAAVEGFARQLTCLPPQGLADEDIICQMVQFQANSANVASHRYMAHMSPQPTTFSILGEMVSGAINNNMLSFELSPLFTQMEERMAKELAQMFGLGEKSGGIMLSGGSLSNLQALAMARNAHAPELAKEGFCGKRMAVVCSAACHTSIARAGMTLGLGTNNVKGISSDAKGRMDLKVLRATLDELVKAGTVPFCVLATAGTTVAGIIDPLSEMAAIAREYGAWFHVDAAYGGALIFSKAHRHLLRGIELADSVTYNPQKWMGVTKTASLLLLKDASLLTKLFALELPYMQAPTDHLNVGEVSLQGSRHTEIVKLWASFQHLGLAGLGALVDAGMERRNDFLAHIEARSFLELSYVPDTNVVCFRWVKEGASPQEQDAMNLALHTHLRDEAGYYLSTPMFIGKRWLKAVLVNHSIDGGVIDGLFAAIDGFVK